MRYFLAQKPCINLQDGLYLKLNNLSQSNKILGCFCSIPVAILDVALDTLKTPLWMIECVAMAAINLVGVAFSNKYTLKDALAHTEWALICAADIPVKLFLAPVKVVFQFIVIIINPKDAQSINYAKPTFKKTYHLV